MSSPSPIDTLNQRLANGEITISEYNQILEKIRNTGGSSPTGTKDILKQGASISRKLLETLFGSKLYPTPTDAEPLQITSDLTLYGTFFVYKGEQFSFLDIKSIGFQGHSQTINLIPANSSVHLHIVMNNSKSIFLSGMAVIIQSGRNKRLGAAYQILSSKTFERRLREYVDELNSNGFIEVGNIVKVKITKDGYLVKGGSKVNLRISAQKKFLFLGVEWADFGNNSSRNPYEVLAGESGTGMFSDRVRFKVVNDRDVVFTILRHLSVIS
ncbi:MAG: hypothetical protein ACXWAT_15535 [Methylobacter sp.]